MDRMIQIIHECLMKHMAERAAQSRKEWDERVRRFMSFLAACLGEGVEREEEGVERKEERSKREMRCCFENTGHQAAPLSSSSTPTSTTPYPLSWPAEDLARVLFINRRLESPSLSYDTTAAPYAVSFERRAMSRNLASFEADQDVSGSGSEIGSRLLNGCSYNYHLAHDVDELGLGYLFQETLPLLNAPRNDRSSSYGDSDPIRILSALAVSFSSSNAMPPLAPTPPLSMAKDESEHIQIQRKRMSWKYKQPLFRTSSVLATPTASSSLPPSKSPLVPLSKSSLLPQSNTCDNPWCLNLNVNLKEGPDRDEDGKMEPKEARKWNAERMRGESCRLCFSCTRNMWHGSKFRADRSWARVLEVRDRFEAVSSELDLAEAAAMRKEGKHKP